MSEKQETHEEMVNRCAWLVMQGLISGQKLQTVMHQVAHEVWTWHKARMAVTP